MGRRHYSDWLKAFIEYASVGEAPPYMYFWVGVSTIAGALRRKVWIDQGHFKWHSNFYVVLVAPPGIIAKSTTASIGMQLLRQVEGVHFGPDVVTWQALVQQLAQNVESFPYNGDLLLMSALTIESSEFGTLIDPTDREMVDVLVSLWDGKEGPMLKATKTQGSDKVVNPWINIIACTTPSWIAGNFPEYMIGGGFTSRCIFVYAEAKHQFVAYPVRTLPADFADRQKRLVEDLVNISELCGPYELTAEAFAWGEQWYRDHWQRRSPNLNNDRFGGYLARKQTHIHKLAMVLAASARSTLTIEKDDLEKASRIVTSLEASMPRVFDQIGRTEESRHSLELLQYIRSVGTVDYRELYRALHRIFPNAKVFESAVRSAQEAGYVAIQRTGNDATITWSGSE